jgi:hypothetical protein
MAKRKGNWVPGPGRPKDSGDFPRQLTVRLTEQQYEYVTSQGRSAAEYIRQLIEQDRDPGRPRR